MTPTHPGNPSGRRNRTRPRPYRYERASFPWRVAAYSVALVYLSLDLYVFDGPVARWTGAGLTGRGRSPDWVAKVYGQPVTRDELSVAVATHLALRGETLEDYAPGQSRLAVQVSVLENLIAERVLATWASDEPDRVTDAEVDRTLGAIQRAVAESASGRERELAEAGSSIPLLRSLVRRRLLATAWVEDAIRSACEVSADEVEGGVSRATESDRIPDSVRVRHLVVAGDSADEETESRLAQLRESATGGRRTLAAAARDWVVERPGTRTSAWRDEGFASAVRMPGSVRDAVWDLPAGAVSEPFRSDAGWHLAEVVERLPSRAPEAADARAEVRARLVSERRRAAVDAVQEQLAARPARHIERYYDNLTGDGRAPSPSTAAGRRPD